MKISKIGRERLYRREYERESLEVISGVSTTGDMNDILSRVVAYMLIEK